MSTKSDAIDLLRSLAISYEDGDAACAMVARIMQRAADRLEHPTGASLIDRERERQIRKWGHRHDDAHRYGDLAVVAAILAVYDTDAKIDDPCERTDGRDDVWGLTKKHANRIERLTVAGALIAAEIDREARRTTERAGQSAGQRRPISEPVKRANRPRF